MKAIKLFFIFAVITLHGIAQPVTSKLTKNEISKQLKYQGTFLDGLRWKDDAGDHFVLRTITAEKENSSGNKDAALYAYHFTYSNDSTKQVWRISDFVKDCELDLTAEFIQQAFTVTDLDKDGQAEIWLMYKISCRGDVSPDDLKLIMYEASAKYAMRGTTKVQVNETDKIGGGYSFDNAFKTAAHAFRTYAEKLWKQYVVSK